MNSEDPLKYYKEQVELIVNNLFTIINDSSNSLEIINLMHWFFKWWDQSSHFRWKYFKCVWYLAGEVLFIFLEKYIHFITNKPRLTL